MQKMADMMKNLCNNPPKSIAVFNFSRLPPGASSSGLFIFKLLYSFTEIVTPSPNDNNDVIILSSFISASMYFLSRFTMVIFLLTT